MRSQQIRIVKTRRDAAIDSVQQADSVRSQASERARSERVEVCRYSEGASQMQAITRGQEKLFMLFVFVCVMCVLFYVVFLCVCV